MTSLVDFRMNSTQIRGGQFPAQRSIDYSQRWRNLSSDISPRLPPGKWPGGVSGPNRQENINAQWPRTWSAGLQGHFLYGHQDPSSLGVNGPSSAHMSPMLKRALPKRWIPTQSGNVTASLNPSTKSTMTGIMGCVQYQCSPRARGPRQAWWG